MITYANLGTYHRLTAEGDASGAARERRYLLNRVPVEHTDAVMALVDEVGAVADQARELKKQPRSDKRDDALRELWDREAELIRGMQAFETLDRARR